MYDKTHSAKTKALMSKAHKGEYPSAESIIKISKAMSGENRLNFGESLSEDTKALMSLARTGGGIARPSALLKESLYILILLRLLFHMNLYLTQKERNIFLVRL